MTTPAPRLHGARQKCSAAAVVRGTGVATDKHTHAHSRMLFNQPFLIYRPLIIYSFIAGQKITILRLDSMTHIAVEGH